MKHRTKTRMKIGSPMAKLWLLEVHACCFLDWTHTFIRLPYYDNRHGFLMRKKTFILVMNKVFTWASKARRKMTTGMTWNHVQSSFCINYMFHILQEEGVELKKVSLRRAYSKYLTLDTCASETKREEEKTFTTIMNKIFIRALITTKGTIWIRYSPYIKFCRTKKCMFKTYRPPYISTLAHCEGENIMNYLAWNYMVVWNYLAHQRTNE